MTVTCCSTRKSYSLGVVDQLRDRWAFRNKKWRQLKPNYQNEEWFDEYRYGVAETKDMLECWLGYLPGATGWDDYNDFSVTFDMEDVEEAGWSERHLRDVLGDMASHVKMRPVIHGDAPWETYRIDAYGTQTNYYRHPAIDSLDGMLDVEYPHDLEPTG